LNKWHRVERKWSDRAKSAGSSDCEKARLTAAMTDSFSLAKFAAYSTDMESNEDSVCADASVYARDKTMLRVMWMKMKWAMKPTTAIAGILALAGLARAQSEFTFPMPPLPTTAAPTPVQATLAPAQETPPAPGPRSPAVDPMIQQTSGCCGNNLPPSNPSAYGHPPICVPGRTCHSGCDDETPMHRLFGGLYYGLCCPDPCYEPSWIPAANAAFFQDSPRPVTQTRIRWDSVRNYGFPDSAEYFWGKIGTKGPSHPTPSLSYNSLSLYQEIAAKGASVTFEMPYYSIDPINNPGSAGFGDMIIGVKSVLLDRELLLVTTQFRTFIPAGNFTSGLGVGHVSLEPALLTALKLTPDTYVQTEIADWIPIGGDSGFEGMVFHYHFSLNHNLYRQGDFLNIVATAELNGYSFRGQFTDINGAIVGLGGTNYLNAGPGFRVQICNNFDLGLGMGFGFGNGHGPAQIYRTELRIRF
jgi:hypothetical protein